MLSARSFAGGCHSGARQDPVAAASYTRRRGKSSSPCRFGAGTAADACADVLAGLEAAYPGIRFRMIDEQGRVRPHIQLFVGSALPRDLRTPFHAGATIMIVGALSGG